MKTFYVSLWAITFTFLWYFLQALLAWREERFFTWQKGVHMAFVHNWAISFGCLFIFPMINGLIAPMIMDSHGVTYVFFLLIGAAVSWALHFKIWPGHKENIGHVLDENYKITEAGWVNAPYTALQTAAMLLYLVTPMPLDVLFQVNTLFLMFLVVQNAQAYYIQKSFKNWVPVCELIGMVLITWAKT